MVQQIARRSRSRSLPDLRHRRHLRLARRGRVHPARLRHRAGLHRRHALRLPHRRRHDRRPRATGWTRKASHHRRFPRRSACRRVTEWKHLDLNYKIVARIDRRQMHRLRALLHRLLGRRAPVHPSRWPRQAGSSGSRQPRAHRRHADRRSSMPSMPQRQTPLERIPRVDEDECVGCNLCWLVCPVEDCITMEQVDTGKPAQIVGTAYGARNCHEHSDPQRHGRHRRPKPRTPTS